jgi:hypothetical protein
MALDLTLQEVIREKGEVAYEVLRPSYERQAAEQFEIFYHTLKLPSEFRRRGQGLVNSSLNSVVSGTIGVCGDLVERILS